MGRQKSKKDRQKLPAGHYRVVQKFAKIAPRKCRYVADLVRGRTVNDSIELLQYNPRKGARLLEKLIQASVANASYAGATDVSALVIKEIRVDEGPTYKRWRARARGRACQILKRMSHIQLIVAERPEEASGEQQEGEN